jgi:hypothetical protein
MAKRSPNDFSFPSLFKIRSFWHRRQLQYIARLRYVKLGGRSRWAALCRKSRCTLVGRDRYSFGWPFHQKNKRNHHQSGDAQEPEIVEVRNHGRLPENGTIQLPIGLMLRRQRSTCSETLAHALQGVIELAAIRRGVSVQRGLMKLRPARQHGCDERNANSCANITRPINQS